MRIPAGWSKNIWIRGRLITTGLSKDTGRVEDTFKVEQNNFEGGATLVPTGWSKNI
jgi:hypothetical protein